MTLPHDIARCPGTTAPLCQSCRRREPGRVEWQAYVEPRWSTAGCPHYIAKIGESDVAASATDRIR